VNLPRALAAALAAAALLLPACDSLFAPKSPFKGVDVTGSAIGGELRLADHNGKERSLADFRGKVVVVSFGYTHCPDVCPTTLADLSAALKRLGADAARVQVLFVTLDPERDTPEVLAKYVPAFDPAFLGLIGDAAATQRAAKEFRIFYEKRPGNSPGAYTVDHSGQSYVIDPQGRLRLFVRNDRIAQDLAEDLRILLRAGG